MKKEDKERVVAELTERLRTTETLVVADYRGLTMPQIDELRSKLIEHGARFAVVKNTLTRRAAELAGADTLLALLEGPTSIAFLESYIPRWMGLWFAVFPTVETLVAQLIAAVLVIGSYFAAKRFGGGPGGAAVEAHAPSMAAINA